MPPVCCHRSVIDEVRSDLWHRLLVPGQVISTLRQSCQQCCLLPAREVEQEHRSEIDVVCPAAVRRGGHDRSAMGAVDFSSSPHAILICHGFVRAGLHLAPLKRYHAWRHAVDHHRDALANRDPPPSRDGNVLDRCRPRDAADHRAPSPDLYGGVAIDAATWSAIGAATCRASRADDTACFDGQSLYLD